MQNGRTFLDALGRADLSRVEELLRTDPMLASAFRANIDSALVRAAAVSAPIAVLQWLLSNGANPNAMVSNEEIEIALGTGYAWMMPPSTPLFHAVRRERPDLVALLLKAGALPQTAVPDRKQHRSDRAVPTVTPKQLAYETGQADVVRMLIQSGDHDPIPLALELTRLLTSASKASWSDGIQMLDQALALYARDTAVIDPFQAWFYRPPFAGAMGTSEQPCAIVSGLIHGSFSLV